MTARTPRMVAGAAILLILAILGAVLLPPYAKYWQLQSYVTGLAENSATAKQPEQVVKTQIVQRASALGLPVNDGNIHVNIADGGVKIDVLYIVQVNVAGYGIDLHFRPAAGS